MLENLANLTQPAMVLGWTYRWHFTSSAVIARLIFQDAGTKTDPAKAASNLLLRMTKKGWLRQVENDELQGQHIYMLSPDGLEEVLASGIDSGIEYDLKPSSIQHEKLRHDLGVQYIVAHVARKQKILEVMPDHVLRQRNESGKVPDAVITIALDDGSEVKAAIEFEREEKGGEKLERFLLNVADDLAKKKYDLYMMYSRIPSIMAHYEKRAKEELRIWKKDPVSKRWVADGSTKIPPDIIAKMRFRYMPEIGRVLSPMSYRSKRGSGG
jgi:hypothetical protein